ncbi:glycosyltransferase family 2 protein [Bizionia sp. KMM 8389]
MSATPLVSIIIPTYNRAHLIGETLDSVLSQTYTNWECIVVDDGSTDATKEIVTAYTEQDGRFQYHKRPENHLSGGNGARNYGLTLAKGTYINWLDSDDLFAPEKLAKQIEVLLSSNANVNVCLGVFFNVFPGDVKDKYWSKHEAISKSVFDALVTQQIRWQTGAVLWNRCFLNNYSWDESLKGGQEWLFHILQALHINDANFVFMDDVLLYIRDSNTSITRDAPLDKRYSNYLLARIRLLDVLQKKDKALFQAYFYATYRYSIRYVRELISANRFSIIHVYGKFLWHVSIITGIKFYFGAIIYKLFKVDYFLKQTVLKVKE